MRSVAFWVDKIMGTALKNFSSRWLGDLIDEIRQEASADAVTEIVRLEEYLQAWTIMAIDLGVNTGRSSKDMRTAVVNRFNDLSRENELLTTMAIHGCPPGCSHEGEDDPIQLEQSRAEYDRARTAWSSHVCGAAATAWRPSRLPGTKRPSTTPRIF